MLFDAANATRINRWSESFKCNCHTISRCIEGELT